METKKYYYKASLEIALTTSDYPFGSINVSHIPYAKFENIFRNVVEGEYALFEKFGFYMVTEELYRLHKDFFDTEIDFTFDFNLFEYSFMLTEVKIENYRKDYYEEPPKPW